MTILAAIDIGSNAMRLALCTVGKEGSIESLENFREPVRLGHDVFSTGTISDDTARRAIAALKRFQEIIRAHKAVAARAVGTSALREAANRQLFVDRVIEETGLHIEVIPGEEEARLVHLAVSHAVDLKGKTALLVDIGGGSVELSLTKNQEVVFSDSVKMGTVRLLHLLGAKKHTPKTFGRLIRKYVESIHRRLTLELEKTRVDLFVGTGGNIEAFGDIAGEAKSKSGICRVSYSKLGETMEKLVPMSLEERMQHFGFRPDRADVIVPAGVVLLEVMKHWDARELVVAGVGLKDGILWDLLPQVAESRAAYQRGQVIAFARALGRKYHFDEAHADRVTKHSLELFDQSTKYHELGIDARLLLEVAGLLHDIGCVVSVNGHHKHSQYLIRSAPFVGLSKRERGMVGCVVRYHRKSLPKEDHHEYQELSSKDRETVRKLAAFLRLAEAFERERGGEVSKATLSWQKERVELVLEGQGDLLLQRWAIANKSDLFENVFKKPLLVPEPQN
jgi:exopolyphosphatase/guanosine-5'-triphosphate,3'-diphosphate pyrophosphatase